MDGSCINGMKNPDCGVTRFGYLYMMAVSEAKKTYDYKRSRHRRAKDEECNAQTKLIRKILKQIMQIGTRAIGLRVSRLADM